MDNQSVEEMRQPLFCVKGAAVPSAAEPSAQTPFVPQPGPQHGAEKTGGPGLHSPAGLARLIKRAKSAIPQAVSQAAPQAAEPKAARPLLSGKKETPVAQRRQLTVRIEMKTFRRLARLATASGQSYQNILSSALDRLLLIQDNR